MKAQRKTAFWPFISICRSKGEARLSRGASRREIKGLARALRGDVSRAGVRVIMSRCYSRHSSTTCSHPCATTSVASFNLRIHFPTFLVRALSRKREIDSCFLLFSFLSPSLSRPGHVERLCFYIRFRHKGIISGVLHALMDERKKELTDTFTGSFRQPATKTMSGHYPAGTSRRTATVSRIRSNRLHGGARKALSGFLVCRVLWSTRVLHSIKDTLEDGDALLCFPFRWEFVLLCIQYRASSLRARRVYISFQA
jgi:hypothetical protein